MEQQIIIILIVCFIGYRIVKRVKSNFSWTELRAGRLRFRMVLFAAIGVLFLSEGGFSAVGLVSDAVGILIGAALGYIGSTMTMFEQRGTSLYYRANIWIGSLVTALFIGRFAYRIYIMMTAGSGGLDNMNFASPGSAWTSGLMLIMFAYYIVYYFLLTQRQGHAASRLQ